MTSDEEMELRTLRERVKLQAEMIKRRDAELAKSRESKNYQKERAVSSRRAQQDLAQGIDYWRERAMTAEAKLNSR